MGILKLNRYLVILNLNSLNRKQEKKSVKAVTVNKFTKRKYLNVSKEFVTHRIIRKKNKLSTDSTTTPSIMLARPQLCILKFLSHN